MLARKHARTIRQAYIPRMTPKQYYTRHERRAPTTWRDWVFAASWIAALSALGSLLS